MKLGFYTGTLYDDSISSTIIQECCVHINNDNPILKNEKALNIERGIRRTICDRCGSCKYERL